MRNSVKTLMMLWFLLGVRPAQADFGPWSVLAIYFVMKGVVEVYSEKQLCSCCEKYQQNCLCLCISSRKKYLKKITVVQNTVKDVGQKDNISILTDSALERKKIEKFFEFIKGNNYEN